MHAKQFVRPDVRTFLQMLEQQYTPPLDAMDPAEERVTMRTLIETFDAPRHRAARSKDIRIPITNGQDVPARLYTPNNISDPDTLIVFFHGGGWVLGDLRTHDPLSSEIACALGMRLLSVDYRLAPEHAFPAAVEDSRAATRWAAESPSELGDPIEALVLAGDSAGGNLAAVCCQELAGTLSVPIKAQWLIYPSVDFASRGGSFESFADGYVLTAEGMDWFVGHYLGDEAQPDHPRASPLKAESLYGQPAALVFTCGLDILRDQGRSYAARLVQHGVRTIFREATGQIHGCFTLRKALPSAQADLAGCIADLQNLLAGH